jgi:NTE family protein
MVWLLQCSICGQNPSYNDHQGLLFMAQATKTISLALQGGGSHGAFTWGVLDALLEDGRLKIDGISGTSAGAMNAIALAHGFALSQTNKTSKLGKPDPREAAREALAQFWGEVVQLGAASSLQRSMMDVWLGGWKMAGQTVPQSTLSPYHSNPLDINPLRKLVERLFDFERIGKLAEPRIYISATHVNTGKAEIFSGKRLTSASLMASACLPMLFHAVEIEGEHYWDGGYSGNPAMHPLIYRCHATDVVLVQINPLERNSVPTVGAEIMERINELTFNASLLSQMRSIDFVNRMLERGNLNADRYRKVLLHRIDGGEALEAFPPSSKVSADGAMIHKLHALGRECAQRWLKKRFNDLGDKTTIDIARDYLDDMRMGSLGD